MNMKRLYIVISLVMVMGMALASCATPTPETIVQTVEVPVVQTQVVKETQIQTVIQTVEVQPPTPAPEEVLPRNETLYYNGLQWSPVVGWNPYSTSMNNSWIAQKDSARVLMFETPYLYDMLDGGLYPLLADGPFTWNDAHTEITYKIKTSPIGAMAPRSQPKMQLIPGQPAPSTPPIRTITTRTSLTPSKQSMPRPWWSKPN
jgi:peptide/nickel transport system substrate-binding protein